MEAAGPAFVRFPQPVDEAVELALLLKRRVDQHKVPRFSLGRRCAPSASQPSSSIAADAGMGVDDAKRLVLLFQIFDDPAQHDVLDDIGEVSGVIGVGTIHEPIRAPAPARRWRLPIRILRAVGLADRRRRGAATAARTDATDLAQEAVLQKALGVHATDFVGIEYAPPPPTALEDGQGFRELSWGLAKDRSLRVLATWDHKYIMLTARFAIRYRRAEFLLP
jgi:hypothetical protein